MLWTMSIVEPVISISYSTPSTRSRRSANPRRVVRRQDPGLEVVLPSAPMIRWESSRERPIPNQERLRARPPDRPAHRWRGGGEFVTPDLVGSPRVGRRERHRRDSGQRHEFGAIADAGDLLVDDPTGRDLADHDIEALVTPVSMAGSEQPVRLTLSSEREEVVPGGCRIAVEEDLLTVGDQAGFKAGWGACGVGSGKGACTAYCSPSIVRA